VQFSTKCVLHEVSHHYAGLNGKMLEFTLRLDVAIDVAHAITYLHTYSGIEEI
jgi:hypothetical protein